MSRLSVEGDATRFWKRHNQTRTFSPLSAGYRIL